MKNIFVQCHGKFTVEVSQGTPSKKKKKKKKEKEKRKRKKCQERGTKRGKSLKLKAGVQFHFFIY